MGAAMLGFIIGGGLTVSVALADPDESLLTYLLSLSSHTIYIFF
jgi:hypothetical protein